MDELGAIRPVSRNLEVSGAGPDGESGAAGQARPVTVTEISASAIRVTGTPALHGRTLVAEDERPDAPPVVVLAYDLWQDRFGGEADVVGRTVRLGEIGAYLLIEVGEFLFIQERLTPEQLVVVAINIAFISVVCMMACIAPTRRALSVEPVEAPNVEG